jgi:hypothetical protein
MVRKDIKVFVLLKNHSAVMIFSPKGEKMQNKQDIPRARYTVAG